MKNHEIETVISDNLSPAQMLIELVLALKKKYNQNVVILIDEYDKPLLDVIDDHALVDEIRKELSAFYSTLKAVDDSLKFLFLTGVSQFAKTSIFSGLNQLKNVSLAEQASALCGYTDEEIDLYFPDYCSRMSEKHPQLGDVRKELQTWYNGYQFYGSGPSLYNPFSVLNALDMKQFNNYWFSTGTPTFLINLLKKYHFGVQSLKSMNIDLSELSELKIENPQWMTLLYQTGYVTIEEYDELSQTCSLRIPNKEVHFSLFNRLLNGYLGDESYNLVRPLTPRIYRALVDNNWPLVIEHLKTIFAKIPYDVSIAREAYYQTIFYTSLLLSGLQVVVEETTNDGRIDCVVTTPTHRYIIEMKLDRPLAETFEQIEKKGYATKYADDKRTLIEIGIIFDSERRTIGEWDLGRHGKKQK